MNWVVRTEEDFISGGGRRVFSGKEKVRRKVVEAGGGRSGTVRGLLYIGSVRYVFFFC